METNLSALTKSLSGTVSKFSDFLLDFLGAMVILLIGWLIARSIRWALTKLLRSVKFDNLADQVGINGFLAKGGLKSRASDLLAKLGYWVVMFFTYILVFDSLGIESVSNLLQSVIQFIPNIVVACILLIVGMYLAKLVQGIVVTSLSGSGYDNPNLVGRIAYGAVMFFTITLVLNQLHIGDGILDKIVAAVVGGLGLGLAIAFGLGGQDAARSFISRNTKS